MKKFFTFLICFMMSLSLGASAESLLFEGDVFIGKISLDVKDFNSTPIQNFKIEIPTEIPGMVKMRGKIELKKPRWFFNRSESVVFNIQEVNIEGYDDIYIPVKARVIAINGVEFEDIYKKTETYKQAVKRNFDNAKLMAADFDFNPMAPIKSVKSMDSIFEPVSWVMAAPAAVLSPVSAIVAKGDKITIPKDAKIAVEILEDVAFDDYIKNKAIELNSQKDFNNSLLD